jgi:hypothetical protein
MSERGSSLVESLAVLALIQIGLLAVVPMFVLGTRATAGAGTMGVVGAAATGRLEDLRSVSFADASLTAGTHTDTSQAGVVVTWVVTDDATPAFLKTVTITATATKTPIGRTKDITLYWKRAK